MPTQHHFSNGTHVKAARALAGMKQTELATLARLHVNSIKRLERARFIAGRDHAGSRVAEALKGAGIITGTWPTPFVRKAIDGN
jgi:DNA-binding XRE family transcriptional regulator